jgi:glycosyltransferase involved in cell wall biosynthesis
MRIGVNLMFLVPGEVGGSEPLLTNLVREIAKSDHHVVVFSVKGFKQAFPDIAESTEVLSVPWSSGAQALRIAAEHSWLHLAARRRNLDLIHHGVGTSPLIRTLPTVVTIHDVQFRHYPENFVRIKRLWLQMNVPYTLRRSSVITVPSQWVKDDIESRFEPVTDVQVVPFGASNLFPADRPNEETIRTKYELERPFFLYASRTYPHKNHEALLEAFAPLADKADLVLTGPPWFRDEVIDAKVEDLGISSSVRRLGLVSREDLGALYESAVALVYPTKFEGFGAPALEAMSLGCPVIASNVTAVPEVVGSAGLLLDPRNPSEWTQAMSEVLSKPSLRRRLAKEGALRASQFTWEKSAEAQIQAYEQALAR